MIKEKYPFIAKRVKTNKGEEWVIEFPDVEGVAGGDKDLYKAIDEAYDNLEAHLDFLKEEKIELPRITSFPDSSYNGKILVRVSKTTHKKLSLLAQREDISINYLINEAILNRISESEFDYNKKN